MSDQMNILDRGKAAAREQVAASVRTRYFPEIWYILESWFTLTRNRRILTVGYGFGLVAEALAKSGWDVTAVDPSVSALTDLRERFAKGGLSATFEQAEPDKLPFAAGSFEAVVSINMLEFSPNQMEAAREIARVLVPGGRAVVATFNKISPWGLPQVARAIRKDDERRTARFLGKTEFLKLLKVTDLVVDDVKDRACYLPLAAKGFKLKLPLAGAYVALLSKPGDKGPARPEDQKGGKPPKDFILSK